MALRWFPPITLLLLLVPILSGLLGTLLPSFGYMPGLEPPPAYPQGLHLQPWLGLLAEPGLMTATLLSLTIGVGSTGLALLSSVWLCMAFHHRPMFVRIRQALAPALAIPHAGFAVGLAFVISPSGWLARLISPLVTGWERPPDLLLVQDPNGIAVTLALGLKEVFFLLLMMLGASTEVNSERRLSLARAMGYQPAVAWIKLVFPVLYRQIRLPIYAVLAAGMANIEMVLVLGPTAPPPLAVLLLSWFRDTDFTLQYEAAAGALLQLGLVAVVILVWRLGEWSVARLSRPWLAGGWRGTRTDQSMVTFWAWINLVLIGLASVGSLLSLAVWSLASRWRWPAAWPQEMAWTTWLRAWPSLQQTLGATVALGMATTALAMVLSVGCLEHEARGGRRLSARALWLIYIPLLLPQIGFLFGVQVLWVSLRLDGSWVALIWSHLLFVLPYVYLVLADPYRHFDWRLAQAGACLGASPLRVLLTVKLPVLIKPLMVAAAVGFAVSVAQYLPTLFASGGRVATLTTETLSLAGGGDRRLLATLAWTQSVLPLVLFALALALPRWFARYRRGLAS